MKAIKVLSLLLTLAILTTGCNTVYVRYRPALAVTQTYTIVEPVYYQEQYQHYDEFYDLNYYPDIWIGTTIIIGGVPCFWCDFCHIWHPRCAAYFCYCTPVVVFHYGFYHFGHYYNHCFDWTYDQYYQPQISTYRFKSGNADYSYSVDEKKREIVKRGAGDISTERVRYQGKNENHYTVDPTQIMKKRTGNGKDGEIPEKVKTTLEKKNDQSNVETIKTISRDKSGQTIEKTPSIELPKRMVIKKSENETKQEETLKPRTIQPPANVTKREKSPPKTTKTISDAIRSVIGSIENRTVEKPRMDSGTTQPPSKNSVSKQSGGTAKTSTKNNNTSTKPRTVIKK